MAHPKSGNKLRTKRVAKCSARVTDMNPGFQISKTARQDQSVKVRASVRGKSYKARISEETLRRAWRAIMIDEE